MFQKNDRLVLSLIIFGALLLFLPALGNFFSGDDWFHLRVVQIDSWQEFMNFFSFLRTDQSISFYRPLSTQFFFFSFQFLFGLNSVPWYLFVMGVFGYSIFLVYSIVVLLSNEKVALWSAFFYGFSVTNFTKLYFLSTFQELSMVVFVLLAILSYLRKNISMSLVFFVLGLMSKETAIVTPILIVLIELFKGERLKGFKGFWRNYWWKLLPFGIVAGIYLYLRLVVFQTLEGDSYLWDFSPMRSINTLFWYGLWSLGAPEFLVDYVGSGLRVISRFWVDFPVWGWIVLGSTGVTIGLGLAIVVRKLKKIKKQLFFCSLWFLISLLPVLFLPWHKFVLELTLPMVGISMLLGWIIVKSDFNKLGLLFVISWLFLNLSMNYLTYRTHYSVNRSKISRKVYAFLQEYYSDYPEGKYFEFINDFAKQKQNLVNSNWGLSKQISHAISRSDMFRVFYKNPKIKVYYEDFNESQPVRKEGIFLNSSLFLQSIEN